MLGSSGRHASAFLSSHLTLRPHSGRSCLWKTFCSCSAKKDSPPTAAGATVGEGDATAIHDGGHSSGVQQKRLTFKSRVRNGREERERGSFGCRFSSCFYYLTFSVKNQRRKLKLQKHSPNISFGSPTVKAVFCLCLLPRILPVSPPKTFCSWKVSVSVLCTLYTLIVKTPLTRTSRDVGTLRRENFKSRETREIFFESGELHVLHELC